MAVRKREWQSGGSTRTAWVADYTDQDGKRRWKQFDRKKDADAFEQSARHEVKRGVHTPDSESLTIKQARDKWIDACKANKLERSAIRPYENHVDLHIIPLLGDVKLSRLTTPGIERFKDSLLRTRSHAMAKKVLSSLRTMLDDMIRQGYLAHNVALPVKVASRNREKERVEIPSKTDISLMLRDVNGAGGILRPLLITAIFTGLRSSELRGLTWAAIDFRKRFIKVDRRADQWGEIGPPKSAAGRRDVPTPPMVVNALREWKLKCPKGALGLVFPNGIGKVESHSNIVNRMVDPLQIRVGLIDRLVAIERTPDGDEFCPVKARHGFHSLRHFYASWIIEQNFIPKRVQELLGHASLQMTYDTYGHLFPNPEDDHAKLAEAEAVFATSLLHGAAGSIENHEEFRQLQV